ncbi:uncharacterized protein LOC117644947 isoform X1 [Thrips palmi]|uniref:Uncharacterized protein LOC117644947 isoform X1 n=1 Tax=Thrips palmi TaxID=161013 RepID=A0A6P8YU66_THRPL|nr:uncharacterized protein LOC117644947 isoform X1 [Thrips palmi]XP_034240652.1 uncharacterized protein LOC117644947 isoform X1 [Thrips palmi]XP_034240653.1 uncharacterized protein LOC117644947 isoform X1 [Thrips palmi]XP_034240654.1 uncharacterized protein LOC117644947 isoform X1 [Thrips palmi]XP_034240655.1 uncharacterized protein LOC117644947 isoform X1 [Thrips palmi]XP_034240656.1 uncharacterized protein LOC117644947 isoform X1 [Thrips palmi]
MDLLSLPDDALLAVLAFLPSRELLSLRVLCRRLRDICLHPDLWRRRALGHLGNLDENDYEQEQGLLRAVLRLVPCLGRLIGYVDDFEFMASMVPTTSCVISELKLGIYGDGDSTTNVLHTVHSLGGLKTLDVHLDVGSMTTCSEILNAIYSLKGLRELKIVLGASPTFLLGPCPRPCLSLEVEPSLTKLCFVESLFDIRPDEGSEPFLISFLETHAATLEEVELRGVTDEIVLSLLGKLPNLRSLACFPVPGIMDFVRQSSQLRSVSIHALREVPSAALQALTESRTASLLKTLHLGCSMYGPDLMAVAGCLPRFPVLRELLLNAFPSDDFLRALTPTSAPRLTRLSLRCDKKCLHAWLHDIRIQDLLQRNPRLHLQRCNSTRDEFYEFYKEDAYFEVINCDCSFCEKEKSRGRRSWFSLHRRTADCPPGCLQVVQLPCSSALPADSSNQQ